MGKNLEQYDKSAGRYTGVGNVRRPESQLSTTDDYISKMRDHVLQLAKWDKVIPREGVFRSLFFVFLNLWGTFTVGRVFDMMGNAELASVTKIWLAWQAYLVSSWRDQVERDHLFGLSCVSVKLHYRVRKEMHPTDGDKTGASASARKVKAKEYPC